VWVLFARVLLFEVSSLGEVLHFLSLHSFLSVIVSFVLIELYFVTYQHGCQNWLLFALDLIIYLFKSSFICEFSLHLFNVNQQLVFWIRFGKVRAFFFDCLSRLWRFDSCTWSWSLLNHWLDRLSNLRFLFLIRNIAFVSWLRSFWTFTLTFDLFIFFK
jgi:hypothetical protein